MTTPNNDGGPPTIPKEIKTELEPLLDDVIARRRETDPYDPHYDTLRREFEDNIEDRGYTVLGSGMGRTVVTAPELSNLAIKMGLNTTAKRNGFSGDGWEQNKREHWTWNRLSEALSNRFTPVYDITDDNRLLLTTAVNDDIKGTELADAEDFVADLLIDLYRQSWNAVELTTNEIGKEGEQYVCFDYGMPVAPIDWILNNGDVVEQDFTRHPMNTRRFPK